MIFGTYPVILMKKKNLFYVWLPNFNLTWRTDALQNKYMQNSIYL